MSKLLTSYLGDKTREGTEEHKRKLFHHTLVKNVRQILFELLQQEREMSV